MGSCERGGAAPALSAPTGLGKKHKHWLSPDRAFGSGASCSEGCRQPEPGERLRFTPLPQQQCPMVGVKGPDFRGSSRVPSRAWHGTGVRWQPPPRPAVVRCGNPPLPWPPFAEPPSPRRLAPLAGPFHYIGEHWKAVAPGCRDGFLGWSVGWGENFP